MSNIIDTIKQIERLKKEKNAIILSHYYTNPEIQDICDYEGDSLGLSQEAAKTDADIILFCGVQFMAETAAIISPEKRVLSPKKYAGCSLAEGIKAEDLKRWREENPDGVVVSYVNTTAEVKAYTDYCCTSANALRVVEQIPTGKKILFAPDRNLGRYIKAKTGIEMEIWDGACHVHDRFDRDQVMAAIERYPNADILIHPESRCSYDPSILNEDRAYIYSTSGMLNHIKKSQREQFIIVTENGILHRMRQIAPHKELIPLSDKALCEYMKMISLQDVLESLEKEQYETKVPEEIRKKAIIPITRMLEI